MQQGIDTTGSPVMNTIWTFCGVPALNLPLLQSASDMPIGVQLVGAPGDDARLLQEWVLSFHGLGAHFEIVPVIPSAETRDVVAPFLKDEA